MLNLYNLMQEVGELKMVFMSSFQNKMEYGSQTFDENGNRLLIRVVDPEYTFTPNEFVSDLLTVKTGDVTGVICTQGEEDLAEDDFQPVSMDNPEEQS